MGIPKNLTTFFIGKSQKIKHFFGCKGKEDMWIHKIFNHFKTKNGNSHFFTTFDIKNWEYPFLKTILRIPIFKGQNLSTRIPKSLTYMFVFFRGVPLISGIAHCIFIQWKGLYVHTIACAVQQTSYIYLVIRQSPLCMKLEWQHPFWKVYTLTI